MFFLQDTFNPDVPHQFDASSYSEIGSMKDLFGIPLWQADSFWQLLLRFTFNFIVCFVIIQFFYYKKSKRRDYYFTFLLFTVTIFLLVYLLDNVKMQIGFALGLFAIFGMIRYRTETVPIREMTYLFITIGISVINGLALTVSYAELVVTNFIFIAIIWTFESSKLIKHRATKIILYDKIDLIKVGKEKELLADLEERTGLEIIKFEIGNIDFLKDAAFIKIYYDQSAKEMSTMNENQRLKDNNFQND
ncbi:MAG: hypothetical protein H6Q25_757 [Bacteroidetes bacterium]|nr:hypothetical protein [Bacteroidota bacterium]